jgi:hypothetical protein
MAARSAARSWAGADVETKAAALARNAASNARHWARALMNLSWPTTSRTKAAAFLKQTLLRSHTKHVAAPGPDQPRWKLVVRQKASSASGGDRKWDGKQPDRITHPPRVPRTSRLPACKSAIHFIAAPLTNRHEGPERVRSRRCPRRPEDPLPKKSKPQSASPLSTEMRRLSSGSAMPALGALLMLSDVSFRPTASALTQPNSPAPPPRH